MDLDWALAIDRNSTALKGIVDVLFAMLGLATRLPGPVYRHLMRPAESAVRRLIVVAACGLVVKPVPARAMPAGTIIRKAKETTPRPSFQLFDTRKRFAELRHLTAKRVLPRIRVLMPGYDPRVAAIWAARRRVAAPAPPSDGLVDARAHHPQASRPQGSTRRSATPGQTSGPLTAETQGHAKSEIQVTAAARPTSGSSCQENS